LIFILNKRRYLFDLLWLLFWFLGLLFGLGLLLLLLFRLCLYLNSLLGSDCLLSCWFALRFRVLGAIGVFFLDFILTVGTAVLSGSLFSNGRSIFRRPATSTAS